MTEAHSTEELNARYDPMTRDELIAECERQRLGRLQAEHERDCAVQESARYRWLKSRIAPTIIQRIDASLHAWPPDRLDEVIDARMRPVVDVGARDPYRPSNTADVAPSTDSTAVPRT